MTKIYLITGFLGSGKTSFLQNVLDSEEAKSGVLMNEFGSISIDSSVVSRKDMDMIELTNGSIFCSCLKDNFIESLRALLEKKLDNIYIESSGLADPANMLAIIDLLKKQCSNDFSYEGAICIVDGLHFMKEIDMMVSVENQIKHSKIILINKMDLISSKTADEIKARIRSINDKALIYEITHGKIDFESLKFSSVINDQIGETSNTTENKPKTIIMKLKDNNIELEEIIKVLNNLKEFCYRIKGFVTVNDITYKIDTVNEKLDVIEYESKGLDDQTLVFISKIGVGIVSKILASTKETLKDKIEIIS
ncbi:GTP-binding protein [Vallitalea guaymasensis]|uniref:GTP-binding protein n=1 Tax=Vallitalea guaymasensis TaxID=1185412 RepID=UPI00187D418A|nr:GTP-binding protein [Vallitalea guaymasensis]